MEDEENSNKYLVFGKDLSEIPCYRSSLIWGIGGGFAGGFGFFFLTSNIRRANNFGMGSFMLTTLAYWCKCRYDFYESRNEILKLQTAIERKTLYQGTALEREIEKNDPLDLKTV